MAGADHAAAGVHPRLAGRPDVDGALGRGPVPVPRPGRGGLRRAAAGPAQAARPGGEVPAEAGLRRPGAGGDPAPAEAALPGARRRQLLRRQPAGVAPPGGRRGGAGSPPEWLAEVTGERSLRAAGVFEPGPVAALMAKCARGRGVRMSNTDNMRVLAVLSTQLTHAQFVAGDGGAAGTGALPDPDVAVDLAAGPAPSPPHPAAR